MRKALYERKKWSELNEKQKKQVLYGDACGDPNNRPKDIREAEERVWLVKNGKVVGWGETVFWRNIFSI